MNGLTLGRSIAFKRKSRGLNQEALADMLGLTRSSVAMWESGKTVPSGKHLIKLSEILGFISPSNFVYLVVICLLLIKLFELSSELSLLSYKVNVLAQKLALLDKRLNKNQENQDLPNV